MLPPDLVYEIACVYAIASVSDKTESKQKEPYARKAVAQLSQTHKQGYYKNKNQLEHFQKNEDLDGLRGRDDFKKLAGDIAASAKNDKN